MKSIRRQLTFSLLAGLFLLLGAVGTIIYFSIRASLREEFDAALRGKALAMAGAIKQEGEKLEIEFRDNAKPELGGANAAEFYEVCVVGGATLRKSRSLGATNLPCELGSLEAPKFFNLDLPTGAKGRAIGVQFVPRYEKRGNKAVTLPQLGLVVAHDRTRLDQSLRSLLLFALLGGVVTLGATVLLVALTLRRCLAPLDRLAGEAERIDAGSLQKRFATEGLPAELEPISSRLNDLLARLEQSFSEISEYSAKVAHELRTPLTILRLKVEQASGRIPQELAEELHRALHHLNHVVDQSLLIARAEQGRLAVQPQPFDLAALVADVVEDFSLLAEEEGRRVHCLPAAPCQVQADPKHTRQIIHNLLSNALKHGHGDTAVTFASRPGECEVMIANPVATQATPAEETLGLGLRVVETLLALQPGVTCERRRGSNDYTVRLTFPSIGSERSEVPPAAPASRG